MEGNAGYVVITRLVYIALELSRSERGENLRDSICKIHRLILRRIWNPVSEILEETIPIDLLHLLPTTDNIG